MAIQQQQTTIVKQQPPAPLLGTVVCTPPAAAAGESICVEVHAPNGAAYDNTEIIPISINGVPGSKQYLVWHTPGVKTIVVATRRPGGPVEKIVTQVKITPAATTPHPSIRIGWTPAMPTGARLTIRNAPQLGYAGRLAPQQGLRVAAVTATPAIQAATRANRKPVQASGATAKVSPFTWEFSNGVSRTSSAPTVMQDFEAHLDPTRPYTVFHVKATLQQPGGAPLVVQRSLSMFNPYFLMKQRGILQPPTVSADLSAKFSAGSWRARFTVRNAEAVDITLTSRMIELAMDGSATAPQKLPAEAVNLVLKAKTTTAIDVVVPAGKVPKNAIALAAHFTGTSPTHLPVRLVAHFDIPEHVSTSLHLSVAAQAALQAAIQKGLVSNPRSISAAELQKLTVQKALPVEVLRPVLTAVAAGLGTTQTVHVLDHKTPAPAKEGDECDPWNLPDVVPDGMSCMPTPETRRVLMPARFMNAMKGDIVLSPANGSLISKVLMSVTPPQPFSHSGMMTRNRDEITHCTAMEDRMVNGKYAIGLGGGGGIRPDILKYGWPGVITQTVQQTVEPDPTDPNSLFTDPEGGDQYTITGFSSLEGSEDLGGMSPQLVPAMVVKPKPENDTDALRGQLHAIADFASQQAGKAHYRFFCYTDPTIGLNTKAPAEAKWGANTFPAVCSSFVWMSIRQSGAAIEGGLEPEDMKAGAQIAAGTPDGLYLYQADERLAAGEALFAQIEEMVLQKAGQFWGAVTDAEEDFGNQVLNAFASDWCDEDATGSDKWRQTVDANAVSPQNLTFYDTPLYGYAEPLIYRGARNEEVTIYKWKKVAQTGTLQGTVKFNGKAVAGADVEVSGHFTHTDGNGAFTLANLPVGNVEVQAQKVQGQDVNSQLLSGKKTVTVVANKSTSVQVDLSLPSHEYRRIKVEGSMLSVDYEFAAAAYPRHMETIGGFADLSPADATHAVRMFDCVADDDTLGRLILTFDLQTDDSIIVKATIRTYDSNQADTDDYDEASLDPFTVPAGGWWQGWMYIDGENYARADFTITNAQNAS